MLARAVELLNENPKSTVEFVFWLNPDYIGEYEARQQYFFQALEMFSDACKEKEMPIRFIEGDEQAFLDATGDADVLLFNAEYVEPFKTRDEKIIKKRKDRQTERLLDRHLLHPHDIKKQDGKFYKVFTPYKNAFMKKIFLHHMKLNGKRCGIIIKSVSTIIVSSTLILKGRVGSRLPYW